MALQRKARSDRKAAALLLPETGHTCLNNSCVRFIAIFIYIIIISHFDSICKHFFIHDKLLLTDYRSCDKI